MLKLNDKKLSEIQAIAKSYNLKIRNVKKNDLIVSIYEYEKENKKDTTKRIGIENSDVHGTTFKSKSERIVFEFVNNNLTRSEIAKLLNIRYQFVNNVLSRKNLLSN